MDLIDLDVDAIHPDWKKVERDMTKVKILVLKILWLNVRWS